MCEDLWPEKAGLGPKEGFRETGGWRREQGSGHEKSGMPGEEAGPSAGGLWQAGSMGEMGSSLSPRWDALVGVWEMSSGIIKGGK